MPLQLLMLWNRIGRVIKDWICFRKPRPSLLYGKIAVPWLILRRLRNHRLHVLMELVKDLGAASQRLLTRRM